MRKEQKNDTAYKKIKEEIISGDLSNDNPMSENLLVEKFQISRTPIRAALQKLQHEGFIKIVPNQGILINELNLQEANQLLDLRLSLEYFMIDQSVLQLSAEDIQRLHDNISEESAALEKRDITEFFKLDKEFHAITYSGYDNNKMKEIVDNCRDRFSVYHRQSLLKPARMETIIREHQEMLTVIEEKDTEAMKNLIRDHVVNGVMVLLKSR